MNYTEQEQSIHKYNGDFIVEDGKVSIKNISSLSIEDMEEVEGFPPQHYVRQEDWFNY